MSLAENKQFLVSWEAFHQASKALAVQLLAGGYTSILAVSRGGLVPAAILARELNLRVVDSICIASYDHNKQGSLQILKQASIKDSSKLLIVDDLVDTGETAKSLRKLFPQAYFVTIYAKPQGKAFVDKYVVDIEQDTWIQLPWDMALSYSQPLAKKAY
ncbi:xanthine phosphoribosyltransferase [Rheinheimera sp. MMS21-TC3]|uniref:xanthine phosphoribosyltransferase n=1 Tax=Rheinheimera sp. MMS21-TC3 TaxID=3072790 RepID=UPI0028C43213|nr:xanthine phosphoribosyltransferase [Rheinheimera sp. MMS21-TC3]WNO62031.1 xanthine phosphoribosyltransferase [Rheinheimera sp. MMS21-TC3]